MSARIRLRRVYDPGTPEDGNRVLVDRLWPRGLRKDAVHLQHWARELAPSDELRKWFDHEVERWPAFAERYRAELADHGDLLDLLLDIERQHGTLTLLFAARDDEHNEAEVIAGVLRDRPGHSHA